MKKLYKYIFIILLICTLIPLSCRKEEHKNIKFLYLSKEQKMEDYEFFWEFIYKAYPYVEVLERRGVDLEKIKEKRRRELDRIQLKQSYLLFYFSVCKEISNNQCTGHLYPISTREYKKYYKYKYPATENGLRVRTIKEFYDYNVKRHNHEDKYKMKLETKIIEENKIAYLRIDTFAEWGTSGVEKYYKDLGEFLDKTKNYKHLIIDVSHNCGGYIDHWENLVAFLVHDSISAKQYVLCSENKYTKPFINEASFSSNVLTRKLDEVPNIENANTKLHNNAYAVITRLRPSSRIYDRPCKERKNWILISKESYSAADMLASFCKASKWAFLVGQNTGGGNTPFGTQAIALPNSGLLIKWDTVYALNQEGYCNAEYGTIPDIYVPEDKDIIEECVKAIHEHDKNNN